MNTVETVFFQFENDFVETMRCIPMIVRYKLDLCLIKLTLADWAKMDENEKKALAHMPCGSQTDIGIYANFLSEIITRNSQKPPRMLAGVFDSWNDRSAVPDEVQEKALDWDCLPPTLDQWNHLNTMQRFALVKLSRSGHEGKNFPAAMREFGLHNQCDIRSLYLV